MIPLLIPVIAGLGGLGLWALSASKKPVGLTADRKMVYDSALASETDPSKLRVLSAAFKKEGLSEQGDMLEKRAALRELPPEVKKVRRAAFKKGMASTNVPGIQNLANAFAKEGATGAASNLRKYAGGLQSAVQSAGVSAARGAAQRARGAAEGAARGAAQKALSHVPGPVADVASKLGSLF